MGSASSVDLPGPVTEGTHFEMILRDAWTTRTGEMRKIPKFGSSNGSMVLVYMHIYTYIYIYMLTFGVY